MLHDYTLHISLSMTDNDDNGSLHHSFHNSTIRTNMMEEFSMVRLSITMSMTASGNSPGHRLSTI